MTLQAESGYAQSRSRARGLAIVPAYNEERTIESVVERVRRESPGFDVVVIDDGSTDCTAQFAERAGAKVLRHPFNLGIGGAVQSGYRHAWDEGYELAVFHSHPSSPPRPSRADLERASLWALRPWLILRTDTRELAAWRLDGGKPVPVALA